MELQQVFLPLAVLVPFIVEGFNPRQLRQCSGEYGALSCSYSFWGQGPRTLSLPFILPVCMASSSFVHGIADVERVGCLGICSLPKFGHLVPGNTHSYEASLPSFFCSLFCIHFLTLRAPILSSQTWMLKFFLQDVTVSGVQISSGISY